MKQHSLFLLAFFAIVSLKSSLIAQSKDDYSTKIDSLIKTTKPRSFNGTVLITQNGETKYSRTYGYSDFENKTPLTSKDNFRIQSNSKQVAAVIILKEVEKGRIELDNPIREYLPEFKQSWADTVTVHQLLNMSSGIIDLDKPLKFKPGTSFNYSNPAYSLLGRIIENITGEKYSIIANNLFKKLGMANTYCYEMDKNNKGIINGYINKNNTYNAVDFESLGFTKESWNDFLPAGGIVSDAEDLTIWDTKLHNGTILQSGTYQAMVNSDVLDFHDAFSNEMIKYGYGVNISDSTTVKYIGHAGRGLGFVSLKFYVPEKKLDVIVLENVYNHDADIIYHFEKEIREIVFNSNLVK